MTDRSAAAVGYDLRLALAMSWNVSTFLATFPLLLLTDLELEDIRFVQRPSCWLLGHDWLDEHRYGVKHVCRTCGKQ